MRTVCSLLGIVLASCSVLADSSTWDAAIGGGIGGAAGAAIGNELGGRDGAIIGGAAGGALGAVMNTDDERRHKDPPSPPRYEYSQPSSGHPHYRFCPPGQALSLIHI